MLFILLSCNITNRAIWTKLDLLSFGLLPDSHYTGSYIIIINHCKTASESSTIRARTCQFHLGLLTFYDSGLVKNAYESKFNSFNFLTAIKCFRSIFINLKYTQKLIAFFMAFCLCPIFDVFVCLLKWHNHQTVIIIWVLKNGFLVLCLWWLRCKTYI